MSPPPHEIEPIDHAARAILLTRKAEIVKGVGPGEPIPIGGTEPPGEDNGAGVGQ